MIRTVEDSLRALQTDYIDLLQFHSGSDEAFDNEAMWAALYGLVQSGKVRHLGTSIGSNTNIYQTSRCQRRSKSEAIQVIYNRLDRIPESEVLPSCQEQNLGVLARVPLASGLLSGKYRPGATFTDPDDIRSKRDPAMIEDRLRQVEEIQRDEAAGGRTDGGLGAGLVPAAPGGDLRHPRLQIGRAGRIQCRRRGPAHGARRPSPGG